MKGITKKFYFDFCLILTEISPKIIFGHMSRTGLYNLGLDGANLVGVGSK
jgi:hypothetical protein